MYKSKTINELLATAALYAATGEQQKTEQKTAYKEKESERKEEEYKVHIKPIKKVKLSKKVEIKSYKVAARSGE